MSLESIDVPLDAEYKIPGGIGKYIADTGTADGEFVILEIDSLELRAAHPCYPQYLHAVSM